MMKMYEVLEIDPGDIHVRRAGLWTDRDRADRQARAISGFVIEWDSPIVADYRDSTVDETGTEAP